MLKQIQIALLLVLLILVGCGEPPATHGGKPAKVYRHAMDGAPGSLDPAQAASLYANFIVVNLYDTLYRYKYLARPYQLQPNLAAAMPEISEDGLQVTIRIKEGVYFMDDPVFENGKGRVIRHKMATRRKLNASYGCQHNGRIGHCPRHRTRGILAM